VAVTDEVQNVSAALTAEAAAARESRIDRLPALLAERILVLDGAMGTMIQRYRLGEPR
jgi:5-methyltetrahydrofolate--homocysteine methyltransferase